MYPAAAAGACFLKGEHIGQGGGPPLPRPLAHVWKDASAAAESLGWWKPQLKGADGATPPAGHGGDANQLISDARKQWRGSSSETAGSRTVRLCVSGVGG